MANNGVSLIFIPSKSKTQIWKRKNIKPIKNILEYIYIKMSLSTLDVASPLPSGVANGLSWSQIASSGFWTANITVPTVTASSALSCSLQSSVANATNAYNAWLITAEPTANTITFVVASDPTSFASAFPISWAVVRN
jgi:hypothetical protein